MFKKINPLFFGIAVYFAVTIVAILSSIPADCGYGYTDTCIKK